MYDFFCTSQTASPLELINRDQLEQWLELQDERVRNWVKAARTKDCPFISIPNADGTPERFLAFLPSQDSIYLAGELPNQLPSACYAASFPLAEDDQQASLKRDFALSWGLASYQFSRYLETTNQESCCLRLDSETELARAEDYVSSIFLTRDMINTPASDMMPEHMSELVSSLASEFGAEFNEVVGDDLLDQNFPTIHAVGRASVHAPRLLELRWGNQNDPILTLVGKGVCFDSGGLNLKPGNFMRLMKKDMGGAAHVLGLARLIMASKLKVQLRVLVPAVENAVAGNAFRPGDVIKTRHGLTVEIDNTDAEGRLVLCDALSLANEESPELVMDFATLTGACRVALGTEVPGFFCNDELTAQGLNEASIRSKDAIWRLPLHRAYLDMLKSNIADTLNSSPTGMGGAITAALYLERFVGEQTPWVHFDVMAWNDRKQPGRPVGGEAMGLRASFDYLEQRFGRHG